MDDTMIPYTQGFALEDYPLDIGETLDVAFATTRAHITRTGSDNYVLETSAPLDKRVGYRACSGIFTDMAISRIYGKQYSEARHEIDAWKKSLTADAVNQCLAAISTMTVNEPNFHEECAARANAEQNSGLVVSHVPAAEVTMTEKRGLLQTMRSIVGGRSAAN